MFFKKQVSSKDVSISLRILLPEKNELVYSTGLKISVKNWDVKNQQVRNRVEVSNVKDVINNKLTKIKSFVEEKFIALLTADKLSKENLKYELDVYFNKVNVEKKMKNFTNDEFKNNKLFLFILDTSYKKFIR
ncbi:hypothetical protein [Lutibacter sp. A64]|uniref:hypothetical protein n=1 Tax=Lutibacter sp. A64 TaxID=2918526 RepID=UPI002111A3D5|nr:hypothetical protein [Lutibacter sp. A64]